VIGFLVWLACAGQLPAQQYYGSLTGTVADPSGARLPGVTVVLTNLNKGTQLTVTTNEAGIYRADNLVPDPYRIEAQVTGFKKVSREPLLVETNRTLTVDITLEIGNLTETVAVTDAPPILETESGKTTATLDGDMVKKLPLDLGARADFRTALFRLPNSAFGGGGRMMINGARTVEVAFDEDGVPNRSPGGGGMLHESAINVESIQSWKYTLVNANAESRAPAQVSLLSRSGSNKLHGALYWDTHHSVFDANSHNAPRGSRKPFARDNYEGLNMSGPVVIPKLYDGRNRSFFMFTVELLQKPTHGGSFVTSPTQAMRLGDFSDLRTAAGALIPIRDPLTGQPFPDNKIPASRLYAGAKPYLDKFYPIPNIVTSVLNNNAFGEYNETNLISRRVDVRYDHVVGKSNTFFFRLFRYNDPEGRYFKFFGSGKNLSLFNFHTYQFNDTHTFSPHLLNEFRVAMSDIVNTQRVGEEAKPVIDLLRVTGIPEILYAGGITGLPVVSISGIQAISQFSHLRSYSRLYDIFDNITYNRNRHSMKFGVNFRRDSDFNETWDKPGSFNFSGFFTGVGVADFMLGLPINSVRAYPRAALGPTQRKSWYASWYAQDDLKVSPRLTLNFGLRWDAYLPGQETHGLYYNFDPKTGNLVVPTQEAISKIVPTFPTAVKVVTAEQAGFPSRLRNTDLNNFSPRLGLAWRPFGEKTVIRTAYGIYTDGLSLGHIPTGGPWGGTEMFTNRLDNGVPLWQFPAAFPSGVVGQRPGTVGVNGFDRDLKNPYVQQWNLTVERQIGEMAVRAQYIGTKGTHLYWYRDLNLPEPSTIPFSDSRRPFPQYGAISVRTNGGNSTYHAMTLAAERRMRNGFTFNSYFTWSRLLTDSYETGSENNGLDFGAAQWIPTFQRSRWKGNENHNPKFRWTTIWYADLPFGRGRRLGANWNRAMDLVAGGWTTTGIFNYQTGWWVSPFYLGGTDPAGIGINSGSLDRIADGVRSNQGLQPRDYFLDPAAFVLPANNIGRFGTAGQHFMQEPSWWTFDFGIQKTFPITERVRFEFLCKVKNLFNHGFWGRQSTAGGLNYSNQTTFGTMAGGWEGSRNIGFLGRLGW
jgi:hypothetical protein